MSFGDRSSSVLATFWYLQKLPLWQSTKPYFINVPKSALPEGQPTTNEISEPVSNIKVTDMREHPASRNIDQSAFTFLCHDFSTPEHAFQDLTSARRSYVPEAEDWICNELGAEYVHTLALEIRRRDSEFPKFTWGSSGQKQPIQGVHCDYTPRYARDSLIDACGKEKARQFEKQRFQIVNLWRPLFGPLKDWPLGLCDFRSLDLANDLLSSDNILPHKVTETYNVVYNGRHEWYYLKDQMPDEILVFKSFDSKEGVATVCPHAAFDLSPTVGSQRLRESVELHMLVVYPAGRA